MLLLSPGFEIDAALPHLPCKVIDLSPHMDPALEELDKFWDECRPWLAKHDINLYILRPRPVGVQAWLRRWLPPPITSSASLPYAVYIEKPEHVSRNDQFMLMRLACAQDAMRRNLVLKLADRDDPEYLVYQRIRRSSTPDKFTDGETFPGVLPAVAILDTPLQYSFIAMPMWGSVIPISHIRTIHQVLQCIEYLLRGLAFLHSIRVAHRDICDNNIVVNCHSPGVGGDDYRELLHRHRSRNEVFYAFIDYNQSLLLPEGTSLKDCRRPPSESCVGSDAYRPEDINLGEPHYNPFAFDVAALGNLFRYHFVEAVANVPGLAALFDRMTDHSVTRRFTAEEALSLFHDITEELPQEPSMTHITLRPTAEAIYNADLYWSRLSSEDESRWGRYRTPPKPLWMHILDGLASFHTGWRILCVVRRVLQL